LISPAEAVPAPGPDAFGDYATEIPNNLRNISTTGRNVPAADDILAGLLPLGFGFDFYGHTYFNAYVSSSGFKTFNSNSTHGCCSGWILPSGLAGPSNLVADFWNDLFPPAAGAAVKYQTLGSPGSRQFVLGF
jgi:hypothetical protein